LSFRDLKLVNIKELEQAQYFVRITAESKIRKLPPVIGYLFIFVSENEFRIIKDSTVFTTEAASEELQVPSLYFAYNTFYHCGLLC